MKLEIASSVGSAAMAALSSVPQRREHKPKEEEIPSLRRQRAKNMTIKGTNGLKHGTQRTERNSPPHDDAPMPSLLCNRHFDTSVPRLPFFLSKQILEVPLFVSLPLVFILCLASFSKNSLRQWVCEVPLVQNNGDLLVYINSRASLLVRTTQQLQFNFEFSILQKSYFYTCILRYYLAENRKCASLGFGPRKSSRKSCRKSTLTSALFVLSII